MNHQYEVVVESVEKIEEMVRSVRSQLSDMCDFIWKSPSVIETERRIEARKIDAYFPAGQSELSDTLRGLRAASSELRIESVYPYMLSTGNFFAALSALEAFLLLLAKEVEILFGSNFKDAKGMGLEKINNHLRGVGIDLNKAECHMAITSAFSIRNCMVHCAGILELSRDSEKIKNIISGYQHLDGVARENARKGMKGLVNRVVINKGEFGERIVISNDYAHSACAYGSTYFRSVCELVIAKANELYGLDRAI